MAVVSLEGPVELVEGKLTLRIPLSAGGQELVEAARGLGEIDGEYLVVVIAPWLAEHLGIEAGSLVAVDNEDGRFHIVRSATNDDLPSSGDDTGNKSASRIEGLTKTDFHSEPLPVIDALVAFVATDAQPAPEVQYQIDGRPSVRWFPTEGGHLVKMPYQGDPVPTEYFSVEPGGWDHEHCDRCGGIVKTGEKVWVTSDADFALICGKCYETLG
ncbi:MAG: hypothetical protein JXA87_02270 [Thermoleophilia bacterium]|nr:hypothetical protein [Thermoleophilia bacterium]